MNVRCESITGRSWRTVFLDILHGPEVQMPLERVEASIALGQFRGKWSWVFGQRMKRETVAQDYEPLQVFVVSTSA
jgi:hypothetical protein